MADEKVIDMNEKKLTNYKKYIRLGIIIVVIVAILAIILSNVFIVEQGQYAVVRQFGDIVRIVDEPGINFTIPFIQTHTFLPKYQMVYDIPSAEITTKDKKRMVVDNYAIWKIDDPQLMIANARTIQNAESIMSNIIFSVIRAELGQLNYDEIINDEKSSRGSFNDRVREKVNELLARDNYGISLTDIRMKRTDLPEENEQAIYRRMISERQSKAQEYLSQGDAEANRIRANTDREVQEILAKANADANEIIAEGEREAARIYNSAFSRDPEFYKLYRTLQSYQKTINDKTVIVIPADSPYARLLMGYTN